MPHSDRSTSSALAHGNAEPASTRASAAAHTLLSSRELLGDRSEVRIEHEGSEYVLRATRNGKLILTK